MSAIDIINGKFFADAAKSTPSKSLYKRGVQVRYMSGKNPIKFRLLPAFNPEDDNPETSVAPWVYADGTPSDWIATIQAAQFVGGDRGYKTILCLETLGQSCPYRRYISLRQSLMTGSILPNVPQLRVQFFHLFAVLCS